MEVSLLGEYYDGTKLLSLKDIEGNTPEIYICAGNRTAGKSVFFKRMCLNNFIKTGKQFILLFRFNYQLKGASHLFFNDIGQLFFPDGEMREEPVAKGAFFKLLYNEKLCGFACSLSNCDTIKQYASYFYDVENIFMDEFQSETNHYCADEITKFQSFHVTVARGHGKHYRPVRTILASNSVTVLNPYYVALGIHKRIRNDTKFMRGNGWVFEQCLVENATQALSQSAFAKAFSESGYMSYASENVYLNDNTAFVEHISGMARYRCTIKYDTKYYGVREFTENGVVYVNEKADMSYPLLLTFKSNDHEQNALMVNNGSYMVHYLRKCFSTGIMRFENLRCKDMIFDILSI